MTDIESNTQDQGRHGDKGIDNTPRKLSVRFNGNLLELEERLMTGSEIKRAAIEQEQPIQADFVLQLERATGEYDPIGDEEAVQIRQGLEFTCIAPDDNS